MGIPIDTLAYARRLREAGFSEAQAEAQAEALAAAMTDTLATKQDLRELTAKVDARFAQIDARFAQVDARFDALEKHVDTRLEEQEKRLEIRLAEQEKRIAIRFDEQTARMGEMTARFERGMADLDRRITLRMVAAIGVVSALVKLL